MADITAKLRNGAPGASRATLMGVKIVERLTGEPGPNFVSTSMQWGIDNEPLAIAAYQFENMTRVERVGFIDHPKIAFAGASPDGLVEAAGLVEVKCPDSMRHVECLLGAPIPERYGLQMQWQMACTGKLWCDYVSFDPRLPPPMRLRIKRMQRHDGTIKALEHEVAMFVAEVDSRVDQLRKAYP